MFEVLRAATKEEVEKIAPQADLGPGCLVVALDTPKGAIVSVIRPATEVDPAFFPEGCDTRWKTIFFRDVANFLIGKGVPAYYFNIPASEDFAEYRDAVKRLGAEQVSVAPELRYKKDLNVNDSKHKK